MPQIQNTLKGSVRYSIELITELLKINSNEYLSIITPPQNGTADCTPVNGFIPIPMPMLNPISIPRMWMGQ